jgi:hypothetical protein
LRAGVPDAAAVQLRRTLEAAAARMDVSERTLVASIQKLIADRHVTALAVTALGGSTVTEVAGPTLRHAGRL